MTELAEPDLAGTFRLSSIKKDTGIFAMIPDTGSATPNSSAKQRSVNPLLCAAVLIACIIPATHAQPQATPPPTATTQAALAPVKEIAFDVVSIKQNKSDSMGGGARTSADGVIFVNTTLLFQIARAYGVELDQVYGLPDWARDNHYDIQYKVAAEDVAAYGKLHGAENQRMKQAVFEDRLKLKVHFGSKEVPMYQLVIAKGGPKLQEAKLKAPDGTPIAARAKMGDGMFKGRQVTVSGLLNSIKGATGRDVIDKTGLTGRYDINLRWAPDPGASSPDDATPDDARPSIFVVLEEQLGLKLEPTKGAVKTLIIDHIEPPSEN